MRIVSWNAHIVFTKKAQFPIHLSSIVLSVNLSASYCTGSHVNASEMAITELERALRAVISRRILLF
jgi:hypothetical protein